MWMNPIKYVKPKTWTKDVIVTELENSTRTVTTTTEDKLKDPFLLIPLCPYIHPQGMLDLIKFGSSNHVAITLFLCLNVVSKKQDNIVNISCADIADQCNLSVRTVKTTLNNLIEANFITREGKQRYRISSKLTWFGNQVDWATDLKRIEVNDYKHTGEQQ